MKQQKKDENKVVLFPGMVERLSVEAMEAVEQQRYLEAIEILDRFISYSEDDEVNLSLLVHCLYETKQFARAKDMCEKLLALEPSNYFEVMEMYLTVCLQLKQFMQVEKIIHSMFDRNLIPPDEVEKFERIQALNEEIAGNMEQLLFEESAVSNDLSQHFEIDEFLASSDQEQLIVIQQISAMNIRPFAEDLIDILQKESLHPFIKSLLLIVLVEQQIKANVTIEKWGQSKELSIHNMVLPTELPQFQAVQQIVSAHFESDPSILELAQHILVKHAIVSYPFEWNPYEVEEVAATYIQYIENMFGKDIFIEEEQLFGFIEQLEKLSELL